jgi:hypothetical protein
VRSLLKSGVWGSGLDTLLVHIRRALRDAGHERFPVDEIESAMARTGKPLTFATEEIDELLDSQYGNKRTFALLAIMYTGTDVRNEFHVDHVFPKSRFTRARLRAVGVPEDRIQDYGALVNRLPNLQLLEGPINISKQATLPAEWARTISADEDQIGLYLAGHDLHGVPEDLHTFVEWCASRRERMQRRLLRTLEAGRTAPVSQRPSRDDSQPSLPDEPARVAYSEAPSGGPGPPAARLHEHPATPQAGLDQAIIGLVRDAPAKLGRAMPAHILWGSRGPTTVSAGYPAHPDYGRFSHVQHRDLLERVRILIAAGYLKLTGDPGCLTLTQLSSDVSTEDALAHEGAGTEASP